MEAYLALHNHVDVCLDTYPYNGGTTTVHAIWMGIPTLTVVGPTPAGRQGAAMLGQLDLDGFIAASAEDFVRKGRYWAENLGALAALRAQLRSRWQLSPPRNPDVIVASLERPCGACGSVGARVSRRNRFRFLSAALAQQEDSGAQIRVLLS